MCVAPTAVDVLVPVAELDGVLEAVVELCANAGLSKAVASTATTLKNIVNYSVNVSWMRLILA